MRNGFYPVPMSGLERNSSSSRGTTPGSFDALAQSTRRRPIPRKGHKKSRAGCLVCKRRKVKCDEVTPQCGACDRLGLACRYPYGSFNDGDGPSTAQLMPLRTLSTAPSTFSLDDLRFFQHFLFRAYPSLPVDGREAWQRLGTMAHNVSTQANLQFQRGYSNKALD